MFFANEQRQNVIAENAGVSFGQVGKILGERWKALNDKQRAPYEAKAAADKKRYEEEKAAYVVSFCPFLPGVCSMSLNGRADSIIPGKRY